MVCRSFFPGYCRAIFFLCGSNGQPSGENAVTYLFSKMIKYSVKGTTYILYAYIFKYLCYNMQLF